MVSYTCPRCKMSFAKKSQYDKHMNRKLPCLIRDVEPEILEDFKCKCGKSYNRKDNLKQHIDKSHNGDITYNLESDQHTNIDQNITGEQNSNSNHNNSHNNNVNININNYIGMAPFGEDGIDFLTLEEKMKVFFSTFNPLEALILIVNLDDERYTHHNVGYTSQKGTLGIVYDGKGWKEEHINLIVEKLLSSKQKDLIDIGNDMKNMLSKKDNQHVEKGVDKFKEIRINPKSRKSFVSFVKKNLYNKRHLAKNARKVMKTFYTGNDVVNKLLREPTFRDNIGLEEAHKIHEQAVANRIQVTTYKNTLNETVKLYKTKGIITQKEADYALLLIPNIHHIEDIKEVIKIVSNKLINNYDLIDKLSKLETESRNQLQTQKDMLLLILLIYHERGIISEDEMMFIETFCKEIREPRELQKIIDIVVKRIFENYNLIEEITKQNYFINNKQTDLNDDSEDSERCDINQESDNNPNNGDDKDNEEYDINGNKIIDI